VIGQSGAISGSHERQLAGSRLPIAEITEPPEVGELLRAIDGFRGTPAGCAAEGPLRAFGGQHPAELSIFLTLLVFFTFTIF
jgi:hypothetical protein